MTGSRAVDLFCGGGGAGLALRRRGFQPIGIDIDPDAISIYRRVAGEAICADVRLLDPADFGPADLVWASPPCQPWSEGRRNQSRLSGFEHPDGNLLLEPVRWSRLLKPKWCIVENVDGIPDYALARLADELSREFAVTSILRLNARFWVPQYRGHVFVIGGPNQVPVPAPPWGTRPRFQDIADGMEAIPVEAKHLIYALRKKAFQTPVVGPDDVLPTVTTRPFHNRWTCFVVDEPGRIRFPTFIEAARAQGFSDDHPIHIIYGENPVAAWRILGNAVPPPLAEAIIMAIQLADGLR